MHLKYVLESVLAHPFALSHSMLIYMLGRVVHMEDNTLHEINHYPLDMAVNFLNIYSLVSNLPNGYQIHPLNNASQRGKLYQHEKGNALYFPR